MFGLDDAKVKRIQSRLDWLTACAVIAMKKLGEVLNLPFPQPPDENPHDDSPPSQ